ncbi:EpsG family protein [Raoultella ornithinolytica]|uniref:EpsG family protein n=3 Tax=Raoultella ornithinolytica TaxID=54291 RepID=UPI000B4D0769|nr:hypothetical protein CEG93_04255 [Raoultella ornithinolytica]
MVMFKKKIRTKNIIYIYILPLLLLQCYFIASRDSLLPDYMMYYTIFNNPLLRPDIEVSFQFISYLLSPITNGFIIFLYIYSILGFLLKSTAFYYIQPERKRLFYFFIFIVSYIFSFAIIWDYIQIRAGVGVSFLLIGLLSEKTFYRCLFLIIAILFHYSMVLPVCLFLLFMYVKNRKLKLLSIPLIVTLSLIFFFLTPYSESYSKSNYNIQGRGIFDSLYLLIYITLFIIYFFRKSIIPEFREVITSIFFTSLTITIIMVMMNKSFPAFTDRLVDITTFLSFLCLFFIRLKWYELFLLAYLCLFSFLRFRMAIQLFSDYPFISASSFYGG